MGLRQEICNMYGCGGKTFIGNFPDDIDVAIGICVAIRQRAAQQHHGASYGALKRGGNLLYQGVPGF